MDTAVLQLPSFIADWMSVLLFAFYALIGLWLLARIARYWRRRHFNLTSVESSASSNIKPDFLSIDHAARNRQLASSPDGPENTEASSRTALLSISKIATLIMALASFVSAIVFAFLRIEDIEQTWQQVSSWERFIAIVQMYPVGLAFAFIVSVGALIRLLVELAARKES